MQKILHQSAEKAAGQKLPTTYFLAQFAGACIAALCAVIPVSFAPVVLCVDMCMALIAHDVFAPLCFGFCAVARLCMGVLLAEPLVWYDAIAIALCCLAAFFTHRKGKSDNFFLQGLLGAACLFLSRIIAFRLLVLDWIILSVQMLVCALLYPVFHTALSVLSSHSGRKILSQEETLAICVTLACLLCGAVQVRIFTLSPAIAASYLLIFIAAYGGGVGLGAGCAAVLGAAIAVGLSGQWLIVCNLTLCAVVCAVFSNNRFLCAISFILTNAVLTLLINGSHEIILNLKETLPACIIFCALPKKWIAKSSALISEEARRRDDNAQILRRVSNAIHARLYGVSDVFSQMAQCFSSVAGASETSPKIHTEHMMQRLYSEVCDKCALCNVCWKRAYDQTYQAMEQALESAREHGRFDPRLLDRDFARRCMKTQQMIDAINHMAQLYIVNNKWEHRMEESRMLVAQQLLGVSDIMHQMADDMRLDISFDNRVERDIRVSLDRYAIARDAEVTVWRASGGYQVRLQCEKAGDRIACMQCGGKAIGEALGCRMHLAGSLCDISGTGRCSCSYAQSVAYSLVTGSAGCAAYGQSLSGDSTVITQLDGARTLLAICDGMGNGVRAHQESSATASLLSNFYKAGFSREAALHTINRLLLLRSGEEMFSTVDMCVFDCAGGTCQVTKIAAAPGILYKNGKMHLIQTEALPMGVADTAIPPAIRYKLQAGDGIIIMSDGITDVLSVDSLIPICQSFWQDAGGDPQDFCDALVQAAIACSGDMAKDDMSVVAAILTESA